MSSIHPHRFRLVRIWTGVALTAFCLQTSALAQSPGGGATGGTTGNPSGGTPDNSMENAATGRSTSPGKNQSAQAKPADPDRSAATPNTRTAPSDSLHSQTAEPNSQNPARATDEGSGATGTNINSGPSQGTQTVPVPANDADKAKNARH